jgi:hypothetical protein
MFFLPPFHRANDLGLRVWTSLWVSTNLGGRQIPDRTLDCTNAKPFNLNMLLKVN